MPLAEKQLRELRIKQRSTIEDIKKKTNYYTTRNLLERYDEGVKVSGRVVLIARSRANTLSISRQVPFQFSNNNTV